MAGNQTLPTRTPAPTTQQLAPLRHAATWVGTKTTEKQIVAPWCWSNGKRAMDIVCGVVALPLVLVLTLLLSLISLLVFRCNPFFIQPRRGAHEHEFRVIKIRSLPKTFHHRSGKHEMHHHELEWWSNFLRNTHLDELPQIINIIGGSMSIVGPRPMIDEVVDTLAPTDRINRAKVKPGLTGPWQISTMGSQPLHLHPELDNQFVEKASLASDIRIILITGATVFGKKPLEPRHLESRLAW